MEIHRPQLETGERTQSLSLRTPACIPLEGIRSQFVSRCGGACEAVRVRFLSRRPAPGRRLGREFDCSFSPSGEKLPKNLVDSFSVLAQLVADGSKT